MAKEERILPGPWSDDEIELLKKLYAEKPTEELAKQLGRSLPAVKRRANMLGLKRKSYLQKLWTPEEVALLKELYPECPFGEIAKRLGRTVASVKQRAHTLGLKRKSYLDKLWTAEELQMLREQYPTCESTRELAKKIGRPWGSVRQIASNLGITNEKRPRDYKF
jgi:hypothetical protein